MTTLVSPVKPSLLGGSLVQRLEIRDPFIAAFILNTSGEEALIERATSADGHQVWNFDYTKVQGFSDDDLTIRVDEVSPLLSKLGLEIVPVGYVKTPGPKMQQRRPRRSSEEKARDMALADIRKQVKKDLKMPDKGKLSADNQVRFDRAFEIAVKKAGL